MDFLIAESVVAVIAALMTVYSSMSTLAKFTLDLIKDGDDVSSVIFPSLYVNFSLPLCIEGIDTFVHPPSEIISEAFRRIDTGVLGNSVSLSGAPIWFLMAVASVFNYYGLF